MGSIWSGLGVQIAILTIHTFITNDQCTMGFRGELVVLSFVIGSVAQLDDSFSCITALNNFVVTGPSNDFEVDYSVTMTVKYTGFHEGVSSGQLVFVSGDDPALNFNLSFDTITSCALVGGAPCASIRTFELRWPHATIPQSAFPKSSAHRWTLLGVMYQPADVDVFHEMAPGCPTFGIVRAPDVSCVTSTCVVSTERIRRLTLGPRVMQLLVTAPSGIMIVGTLDATQPTSGLRVFAGTRSPNAPTAALPVDMAAQAIHPYFISVRPLCVSLLRVGAFVRQGDRVAPSSGMAVSRVCVVASVVAHISGGLILEQSAWVVGASAVLRIHPTASVVGSPFTTSVSIPVSTPSLADPGGTAVGAADSGADAAAVPVLSPVVLFGTINGPSDDSPVHFQRVALVTRSLQPSRGWAVTGPGGAAVVDGAVLEDGSLALVSAMPTGATYGMVGLAPCLAAVRPPRASPAPGGVTVGVGDRIMCSSGGVLLSLCGASVAGKLRLPSGVALDATPGCNLRTDVTGLSHRIGDPPHIGGAIEFIGDSIATNFHRPPSGGSTSAPGGAQDIFGIPIPAPAPPPGATEVAVSPPPSHIQTPQRLLSTFPPTTPRAILLLASGVASSGPLLVASGGNINLALATAHVVLSTVPSPTEAAVVTFGSPRAGGGTLTAPPTWLTAIVGGDDDGPLPYDVSWAVSFKVSTYAPNTAAVVSSILTVEQLTPIPTLYMRAGVLICPLLAGGWFGATTLDGSAMVDGVVLANNIARLRAFVAATSGLPVQPEAIAYQGVDTVTAATVTVFNSPVAPSELASVPAPVADPSETIGRPGWASTPCTVVIIAADPAIVRGLGCASTQDVKSAAHAHLPPQMATSRVSYIDLSLHGYPPLRCDLTPPTETPTPIPPPPQMSWGRRYKVTLYGLIGLLFPITLVCVVAALTVMAMRDAEKSVRTGGTANEVAGLVS